MLTKSFYIHLKESMMIKLLNSSNSRSPFLLVSSVLKTAVIYSSGAVTPSLPSIPLSSVKLRAPLLSVSNCLKMFLS